MLFLWQRWAVYFSKQLKSCDFSKDFDNDTKSDCIGLEISALSILESEESYVNILLGDYEEPEVRIESLLDHSINIFQGLSEKVFSVQLRGSLPRTVVHQ